MFPDENSVLNFLEGIVWADGVNCSRCNCIDKLTKQKDGHNYWCGICRKYFNVRTNTPMERSNIPLQKWMFAIYLFMTSRKGVSSLQLSKELDITQKSAWFMCQRIREMLSNSSGMLSGIVEVDEVYIGGLEKNKHVHKRVKGTQGRSTKTKSAVVGIRERSSGKVYAQKLDVVGTNAIQSYIDSKVKRGSTLSTDEARFYKRVEGYNKLVVNHSAGEYVNAMASTNGIESVWAVLKRGYHGTFHHFSKKHLQRYVDEFTFRLNAGTCKVDTIDRINAVIRGSVGKKLSYRALIR